MRKTPYAILLFLLLAFALRLYRLPVLSLRGDEAAMVFDAARPLSELLRAWSHPNPNQPLYYLLSHFWLRLAGDSPLAVRYLTVSGGMLLVALIYAFGRQLCARNPSAAFWATLAAAINPMLIWDAQDNRMYAPLAALNLASFCFCLRLLERGGRRAWLGFVLCATLALYTHYMAFFLLLTELLLWLALVKGYPQRLYRLQRGATAGLAIGALFAPWLLYTLPTATGFSAQFVRPAGVAEMLRRTITGLSLGLSVGPREGLLLGLGFASLALWGLWKPSGGDAARVRATLLVSFLAPIACIVLFSWRRFPIFDERYLLIALPPYLLSLGLGLSRVTERGARRALAVLGLVWVLLASGYSLYHYYHVPRWIKGGIDWVAYVNRLLASSQPGDLLIQNYPDPALTYHLRNRLPRALLPESHPLDRAATVAALEGLLAAHPRLWLQPQRYAGWDDEGLVEQWMERRALRVGEEQFGSVRLALYLTPATLHAALQPVGATLGDEIEVVGYRLEPATPSGKRFDTAAPLQTPRCRAGKPLQVTVVWQAVRPVPKSYTVFVHLYDAQMRLAAQQDRLPVEGRHSTDRWPVGELVVDRYTLEVPENATGVHRLGVGMYLLETGARLPVQASSSPDRILWLEEMEVTR